MDNQTLMTVFVGIAAVSLLIQLGMLVGLFLLARRTQQVVLALLPKVESLIPKVEAMVPKVEALMPKVHALLASSQGVIDDNKQQVTQIVTKVNEIAVKANDIAAKTGEILDSAKRQVAQIEGVVTDASGRAKVQLERAEMVVDDTMGRAHETVAMVHNGITRPLREIQGIATGVRTAIAHFANGGRPSVVEATHDEEMFI